MDTSLEYQNKKLEKEVEKLKAQLLIADGGENR